jgi:hypothetical protein
MGTFDHPEEAVIMYDLAVWRFNHHRCNLNFPEVSNEEQAKFQGSDDIRFVPWSCRRSIVGQRSSFPGRMTRPDTSPTYR